MDVTDSVFRAEVPEYERVEAVDLDMEPRGQDDTGPQMHLDAHADGENSRDPKHQIDLVQEPDSQSARVISISRLHIPI